MIYIQTCALHFASAKSCWHGQCSSTGSDFPRGVFYYVLLRRLTTWRDEELPTLASPCKGRGERVASKPALITIRFLHELAFGSRSRTRLLESKGVGITVAPLFVHAILGDWK